MKKTILLVMAMILLISSALAEDFSGMTDEELLTLYRQVSSELANRNLAPDEADEPLKRRLYEFMSLWYEQDIAGMVHYSTSDWQAKQDNPQASMFSILKNRQPQRYELISVSGDPEASVRFANCDITIDWNTGKPFRNYNVTITMVLEDDSLWHVDPTCLETNELPEATLVPVLTPAPEQPAASVTRDTVLYYSPDSGSKYHLDPNCPSVNEKFAPLQASFRYRDVNDPQYQNLKPCLVCGAPERQPGNNSALTPAEYTQRAWAFTAENYAELLNNPESILNQPFCAKGMVQEVISENPLTIVINTSPEDGFQPVIVESPDANRFHWEKSCEYQIYGDFVSVRDGMPVLSARFSFTW